MEYQCILNIMSVCLYSCVIYTTCKTHTPHYIAICDLICCTTLFYKRHDFRKKRSTHYVLIFSTRWSETLQVHSAAHCHECTEAFMKCLVILWVYNSSWIFYIDVRKMLKNPKWRMSKLLVSVRSLRTERPEETQYSFLSILHSLIKVTYTKLHTQRPYKTFPWVPSCTSNKKKFLILLNKLPSKGDNKAWQVVVCVVRRYWYINVELSELKYSTLNVEKF